MKVSLVFAGISESGFNKSQRRLRLVWINHGLASIASSAKRTGHDVGLIDLRQLTSWDHFKSEVEKISPAVVGITMMSVDYGPAAKAAAIVKNIDNNIKVVAGGPHPSLVPEEVVKDGNIDYVIQGEGEITFNDLLKDLADGINREKVVKGTIPDLNALPFADRDIFGAWEMPIDHFLRIPFVTVIAGRGCRYNCSFCQPAERHIFGPKVRRRSVDNVIEELKILRDKLDFQSLMLHDDCLTEDRQWVEEFCDKYRTNKFRQPFVCQSRADLICKNEPMVKSMCKAGLAMFLVGFESGNQRILNLLRKGTTVEQNLRANDICRRYGIRVWANYMFGVPTETKEEMLDTLRMIKKIRPYRASPAIFTPHPGSNLYETCIKEAISLIRDHKDYARSSLAPKIKGIDYIFLNEVLNESQKIPLSVRIRRKVDHTIERKIKKYIRKFIRRFAGKKSGSTATYL